MSNIVNRTPYVRTSRSFPETEKELSYEVDKTYIDLANAINQRTIGIFPTNNPCITGNAFYVGGNKQQSLRQLYTFGAINAGNALSINITYNAPYIYIGGACVTSQPDSRPIPYSSNAANSQIDVRVDKTTSTIVIRNGSGGPNIVSGYIVLEWISLV